MLEQLDLPLAQRWRGRRDSYRPAAEPIDPRRYGVEVIRRSEARAFVERHHYSGSYPAARCAVALYRARAFNAAELVGVAVFSVATNPASIRRHTGVDPAAGVELGRFILLDDVPGNGETWFLARAFRALRAEKPEVRAVLSYSDPVPRMTVAGEVVKPGHIGVIYQAHNGRYVGRGGARTIFLDASGRVVSGRALSKLRCETRGQAYAEKVLLEAGAPARRPGEDGRAYVRRALAEGPFRALWHPGNHAYVWPLDRAAEAVAAPALPYPKGVAA